MKTLEGEILLKPAGAKCIFEISLKQMLGWLLLLDKKLRMSYLNRLAILLWQYREIWILLLKYYGNDKNGFTLILGTAPFPFSEPGIPFSLSQTKQYSSPFSRSSICGTWAAAYWCLESGEGAGGCPPLSPPLSGIPERNPQFTKPLQETLLGLHSGLRGGRVGRHVEDT